MTISVHSAFESPFTHGNVTRPFKAYMDAVEPLAPLVGALGFKDIVVVVPHGFCVSPSEIRRFKAGMNIPADTFVVAVWSSAASNEAEGVPTPAALFSGVDIASVCRDYMRPASRSAGALQVMAGDVAVGEIFPADGVLYMFWDAAHTGSTAEQTVWARFMEAAGSVLASTLGDDIEELRRKWEAEREARRIEEEKRRDEETRQRIIAAITSRATQDRREAEQRVASLNDAIDSYKRELVGKIRQLDTARRQLDALKNGEVDYTKKAVAEIDAIGKLHGVERFEVDGDLMKIYTTKLLCYDGRGNAYQLGRFRIELKLGTSDVRFFGLDPEYCRHAFWSGADPHPHVDGSNGRPCIGNLAETVAILTAQYELAALTSLLVNWLEACNTSDSAGARVTAWDKVNPDTGEAVVDGSDDYYEFHCEECGAGVDEDDTYRCYHCDEIFCEEHAHFIDAIDDYVCTTCRDENYTYCAECHTWVHNDNATEVVNQRGEIIYVCARCRDDHYEHCEDCGRYMYQDHMRYIDDIGRAVCDDCANDDDGDYAPCSTCGEWYLKDNLDEDGNCEDCHVEHDGEDSPEAAMERHDIMTTTVVADDDFAAEVLAAATADMVTCQFCGQLLLPEQLMTCEQCGEQGCGDCVKFSDIDGQYRCPTHR